MAMDISAVGAKIVFKGGDYVDGLTITEFSDEGTPFECSDVDVSDNQKNLNGQMISSRKPAVYPFSITVIPGSLADETLRMFLSDNSIQPGNNAKEDVRYIDSVTITMPNVIKVGEGTELGGKNEVTFSNVRIKGGPTGPSTSAEGRMSARTYTFEAESFV